MAYKIDPDARYAKTHEWARMEGKVVVIGISDYAQHLLSDMVYVELPEGDTVTAGESFGTVESVKAAEDALPRSAAKWSRSIPPWRPTPNG